VQTQLMMRASRAAQIAHRPAERPYVVTRSGMAGMQRYAQSWSGDNYTAWKTIRYNQKMALGMALSGVSNFGHDIGGFAGPKPDQELFLRWVQAGIVMPRFSIHSWNSDHTVNEPWMYPEATPAIVGMMQMRRVLQPMLHDLLWRHHAHYEPVSRPLWLDFPDDPRAWDDGDAHLLGPDLLVAPVMDAGATTVTTYLPSGATWYDIRDDRAYAGGADVALPAPLSGLPPMLAREASGLFLDVAPSAARPQPAVLLYPPQGEGQAQWSGFDETDNGWPDADHPPLWQVWVKTASDAIALDVAWTGTSPAPAPALRLVLPMGETRPITLNGTLTPTQHATVLGLERPFVDWQA
jgi:alpha-glucosidase